MFVVVSTYYRQKVEECDLIYLDNFGFWQKSHNNWGKVLMNDFVISKYLSDTLLLDSYSNVERGIFIIIIHR